MSKKGLLNTIFILNPDAISHFQSLNFVNAFLYCDKGVEVGCIFVTQLYKSDFGSLSPIDLLLEKKILKLRYEISFSEKVIRRAQLFLNKAEFGSGGYDVGS